jgi:phenylacetate-CoA ligase
MYSYFLRNLIYPMLYIKYPQPRDTLTKYNFLGKTQWWSLSELESFQKKRLRSLLTHSYENVPYYHRMFNSLGLKPQDIKSVSDLKKLPFLTKEIIRKNFDDLTAQNYSKKNLIRSTSGGSTSEPIQFFVDREWGIWNMAAAYREWSWAGYHVGDKMAYLWGAPHDISQQIKFKRKFFNFIQRTIWLDSYTLTDKILEEYIKILKKFKPRIINAYTSSVYLMASYMIKKGIRDIRPEAILTSCEMLFDYQRDTIENAFDCEVFDYYSGRDTTLHAGECSHHTGYHLAVENAIPEFIKDNEYVSPGEMGKIMITDLSNYAMPFIRYEIGDLGVPSDERCSCGRGLPLMKQVAGRIRDTIVTKDKRYVTGSFFMDLFMSSEGIKQFQFVQKTKDTSVLKIVKGECFSQSELDAIIEKIQRECGDMKIETKFEVSIPSTPSGKYRSTISEVELEM